ncbi:MAG: 4-hydroxy-tetrahydrodipicolinate reductase [Rhodospirillales bacterium]
MRIGIAGAAGRMGRMLAAAIVETPAAELAGGLEFAGHPAVGSDLALAAGLPAAGLTITDDPEALFAAADAVLDFTTPQTLLSLAPVAARAGKAYVVGTTGLGDAHFAALREAAQSVPIVQAANMSVGVNLLLGLVAEAAAVLGRTYDLEIVEMHHRHKVDAPSGTALALGEAAAAARGQRLADVWVKSRDGHTGARPTGAIGFATLRGGDVTGDHQAIFAGDGERIELGHRASSRAVFASGAVRAALWTAGRPPGLYGMRHVLGFA